MAFFFGFKASSASSRILAPKLAFLRGKLEIPLVFNAKKVSTVTLDKGNRLVLIWKSLVKKKKH